jgi:hypothetical protein
MTFLLECFVCRAALYAATSMWLYRRERSARGAEQDAVAQYCALTIAA